MRSQPPTAVTVFGCEPDEAVAFRMAAPRFGVAPTLVEDGVSEANAWLAGGSRCVSVSHRTPVTGATLAALSSVGVRFVSTRSAGFDHIDLGRAEQLGLRVGNVAYSPDSVADYTLMLMLMALRHTGAVLRRVEQHDYRLGGSRGRELRDLTVGVVGAGRIGSAVLERLRGFGARVLVHDSRPDRSVRVLGLDDLLRGSDVVTLHTPLTPDTHHLLDRGRIARMRPGAVLVNTGRGPLVDTGALLEALESGHLGGAALDVVEGEKGVFYTDRRGEPPASPVLRRLHRLPNVVLSPHQAYYTDHALGDVVDNTLVACAEHENRRNAWTA